MAVNSLSMALAFLCIVLVTQFIILLLVPVAYSLPFIVLHGIGNQCRSGGVSNFTELLANYSGSPGYCIEVGNGFWDSWFVPLENQTREVCEKVKAMRELSQGYNIVGLSQGNLIGRGVVEFCDGGPPVKNFVSVGGPHAGIAYVPHCGSAPVCIIVDMLLKAGIYSDLAQAHLAPSGYLKFPNDISGYLGKCKFLPKLNNEIPEERDSLVKERFSSLQNLVLIMSEDDEVLIPKETSWFGYYPDGAFSPVVPVKETPLYTEDWIGLRALDETGRVHFVNVSGGHVDISESDMKRHIVPFLVDKALPGMSHGTMKLVKGLPRTMTRNHADKLVVPRLEDETSTERILDGSSSSSYEWPSSGKSFENELVELAANDSD